MFGEDYQKDDLPENCTTFFERLNKIILAQRYTERQPIHIYRDIYKSNRDGGYTGNIYVDIFNCLVSEHGIKKAVNIYKYLTEHTR